MQSSHLGRNRFHALLLLLSLVALPVSRVFAQKPAPLARTADFTLFGLYASVQPDYNSSYGNQRNNGFSAGGNYTYYGFQHLPIQPSFELRGSLAKGTNVNEGTGLIGPRVQATFHSRIHPYANFLVGFGDIYFNKQVVPGYVHDSALVYSVGGGVDVELRYHFQLKVDYQYQFWNTGDDPFSPNIFGAGLSYRIPMHSHS